VASVEVADDGSVLLTVHVQPGASRPGVAGTHGDALKVKVAAPPERGRANAALERLLAEELGLRPADVAVVAGHTGRRKRVRLRGADPGRVRAWVAAHGG
jgi:uncharacterized protein (TIGR00251 family)